MMEVEIKFPLSDPANFHRRLKQFNPQFQRETHEADIYLNAPDRDFAQTDEALRLRMTHDGNCLTYKGPRVDATTKTRIECEVECVEGKGQADQILRLFTHLGYRRVAEVRKLRRVHAVKFGNYNLEICEDLVTDVGSFVEIEIMLEETEDLTKAKSTIFELAEILQLGKPESRSYLEQLLRRPTTPGGEK